MANNKDVAFWKNFFKSAGIPPTPASTYTMLFVDNRIQKSMLLDLTRELLREIGVVAIGDIIAILKHSKLVHDRDTTERVTNIGSGETQVGKAVVFPMASSGKTSEKITMASSGKTTEKIITHVIPIINTSVTLPAENVVQKKPVVSLATHRTLNHALGEPSPVQGSKRTVVMADSGLFDDDAYEDESVENDGDTTELQYAGVLDSSRGSAAKSPVKTFTVKDRLGGKSVTYSFAEHEKRKSAFERLGGSIDSELTPAKVAKLNVKPPIPFCSSRDFITRKSTPSSTRTVVQLNMSSLSDDKLLTKTIKTSKKSRGVGVYGTTVKLDPGNLSKTSTIFDRLG